jgi:hypothetical protein
VGGIHPQVNIPRQPWPIPAQAHPSCNSLQFHAASSVGVGWSRKVLACFFPPQEAAVNGHVQSRALPQLKLLLSCSLTELQLAQA